MTKGARDMLSTPPAIISSALARLDGARRDADGVHARSAQAVHGCAGNFLRQSGQQQRHARDVAIVLAGLIGAAENHVVDRRPIHLADCALISALSGSAARSSVRMAASAPP